MHIENYLDKTPTIEKSAKIFQGANVIGDVTLGKNVGIWYNVTLRGDMAPITIGDNTNIQDHTVVHTDLNMPTTIGKNVTVGHMAIIHAATVHDEALIGMGSIILDGAVIGKNALVAAGTVVPPGKTVPERTLVMGNPMRIVKELSDEAIQDILRNKDYYVKLIADYNKL